jgi:hypothetical protein
MTEGPSTTSLPVFAKYFSLIRAPRIRHCASIKSPTVSARSKAKKSGKRKERRKHARWRLMEKPMSIEVKNRELQTRELCTEEVEVEHAPSQVYSVNTGGVKHGNPARCISTAQQKGNRDPDGRGALQPVLNKVDRPILTSLFPSITSIFLAPPSAGLSAAPSFCSFSLYPDTFLNVAALHLTLLTHLLFHLSHSTRTLIPGLLCSCLPRRSRKSTPGRYPHPLFPLLRLRLHFFLIHLIYSCLSLLVL